MDLLAVEEVQQLNEHQPASKQFEKAVLSQRQAQRAMPPSELNADPSSDIKTEERPFSDRFNDLNRQKRSLQAQFGKPEKEEDHEPSTRLPMRHIRTVRPVSESLNHDEKDVDSGPDNRPQAPARIAMRTHADHLEDEVKGLLRTAEVLRRQARRES